MPSVVPEVFEDQLSVESGIIAGEETVLKFWKDENIFSKVQRNNIDKERFVFYDGPPFATGLPHYGSIMVSIVKDIVGRYKSQKGYFVERRFGWDCHGLPIEFEINKILGINSPQQVLEMGIDKYNDECRKVVMKCATDWERTISRIGRWVNFEDDYKTMNTSYMESTWWVFKQLYEKGLVYKGFRVMPYSVGCNTPLSNFEATLEYKNVNDPSIIVTFPLKNDENTKLLAWTTTPWTLPSNLALCVNPDLDYVKIKNQSKENEFYILLESRMSAYKKLFKDCVIVEKMKGSELAGLKYIPLFDFFLHLSDRNIHRVLCDNYVSSQDGTGIVHQAPYFGDDDFRVALNNNIINNHECVACPIDECGCFTDEVPTYKGLFFKDADKIIVKDLKTKNRILLHSSEAHNYPYCWRSKTPLMYKSVSSWFINVEKIIEDLKNSNEKVNWIPKTIKSGRFGNWIANARDWLVSRNRFWGCPIPIWTSEDCEEIVCIGSINELKNLTGIKKITDLHRDSIDGIEIDSKEGKGKLKRIPEIFDCWFESGCVPFSSNHYPFENLKSFDGMFPADFIAEGIDQCRGWFYTLMIISTALFGISPYKNVVALGLIMAEDGQKMSKSKKNYPETDLIIGKYGADALRVYLTGSNILQGDSLNFKESDVAGCLKQVTIPLYNSVRFFSVCVDLLNQKADKTHLFDENEVIISDDPLDKWIVSLTHSITKSVCTSIDKYELNKAMPSIPVFIENLNNWYIKLNRSRMKGSNGVEQQINSLKTLYYVLKQIISLFSPVIPFMTERLYQFLKKYSSHEDQLMSIHLTQIPKYYDHFIDQNLETSVKYMQNALVLIRASRDHAEIGLKIPLKRAIIITHSQNIIEKIKSFESYILEQGNLKILEYMTDVVDNKLGARLTATLNYRQISSKVKKDMKKVAAEVEKLSQKDLEDYKNGKTLEVCGYILEGSDLNISYGIDKQFSTRYECQYNDDFLIVIDKERDANLDNEATCREITSAIQKLRKQLKFVATDFAEIQYWSEDKKMHTIINQFNQKIENQVNGTIKAGNCDLSAITEKIHLLEINPENKICCTIKK